MGERKEPTPLPEGVRKPMPPPAPPPPRRSTITIKFRPIKETLRNLSAYDSDGIVVD